MKKILVGFSALVFVGATIALWQLNHGFVAFLNFIISGIFIGAAIGLIFNKEDYSTGAVIAAVIAAVISIVLFAKNSTDYKVEKEQEKAEQVAKEKARIDAMTPEERKQEEFNKERTVRGFLLTEQIKASAFDPGALQLKSPKYFKNGVCVEANGKNRFGAYVGWKEYCYLVDDKGVWTLHE